jgi:hypothetical protein
VALRFLLDENIDPAVGTSLSEAGHDAVHVQDVDELGKQSHDHEIATHAKWSGRHVLTNDDDFYRELDDELPTLFFLPDQRLPPHRITAIIGVIEQEFPGGELDEQPAIEVVDGWL